MAGKRALTAVAMLLLVMGAQVLQASPPLAPRRALPAAVAMVAAGGSPTSAGGVKPSTTVVLETKSAGDNFNGKDEKFPAVAVAKGAYHLVKYIARHFPTYVTAAGRCISTIGTHCGWSKVSRHCLQEALHKCYSEGA